MTTRMLINATVANELRIAIVQDGELAELDIETDDQNQIKGNIYKGVIHNVEASLEAAFVDIGGHKQGFLPFSEVQPSAYGKKWKEDEPPRIGDVLKRGQEIVVQVAKDAIGEKGATLTTHLSIPGRFTVLMPGSDASGVSRKIDDEAARKKIRALAAKIERPEDCGFIVRTAGLGQPRAALQKDLSSVVAIWEKVKNAAGIARAPSLLYAEPDLISRTLRDFFTDEIDEIWIDNKDEFEAARSYFEELMPQHVERIHWYQNPIPIFAYYHVEEQIESTFHRVVPLPSGGSIVIDQTEALVAIDVNSGKNTSERDHEETVTKTNLEAAEEAVRQMRLRDLGGIVAIDFIDMETSKNERLVEKALLEASKDDKARYKISRINQQGLCVLTRQRLRQGMRKAFQRRCAVCAGTGWLRTPESHSLSLLRRIETRLAQGEVGECRVATHKETAEYLLNTKRAELLALERQYQCRILISARTEMERDADDVTYLSKGEVLAEITDRLPPREEVRLQDRAARRKKKRKKRLEEQQRAASESSEEPPAERAERAEGEEGGKKKKRRRRRDRGEAPQAQAMDNGAPRSPEAEAAPAEEAPPPGGTTFTGRPPPEVLERLKAERKARMMQRNGRPQGAAPEMMNQPSQPPMPAERQPELPMFGGLQPPEGPIELPEPAAAAEPSSDLRPRLESASPETQEPAEPRRSAPAEEPKRLSLLDRLRALRRGGASAPEAPPPQSPDGDA